VRETARQFLQAKDCTSFRLFVTAPQRAQPKNPKDFVPAREASETSGPEKEDARGTARTIRRPPSDTFEQDERLKAASRRERPGMRPTLFGDRLEWLMLACDSGMRPGEQTMLEFLDIDLVHGFILVQAKPDLGFHIKNYQDPYIPLAPESKVAVDMMRARRRSGKLKSPTGKAVDVDFVFHRPDGSCWGDLADSMDALFVAVGLNAQGTKRRDRITLHSLRHTFAAGPQEYRDHREVLPSWGKRHEAVLCRSGEGNERRFCNHSCNYAHFKRRRAFPGSD